jgi:hypothetical protein
MFNIFVNNISAKIKHSKFLLLADDLQIYRHTKSVEDCKALQRDTDTVQQRFLKTAWNLILRKLRSQAVFHM